ncbi:hypothetical protein LTR17_000525 [Elasticomyces elasticus]|nr:hypothetical protein LTR17_000525 [Elasticomyces elasticus]
MGDISQGKTLDDVYGILSKLAESQAAIAQSQASLAQSHASLAEGQAALSRGMSELVNVQKEALEAQKETAHSALSNACAAANAPPPPIMDAGSRLIGIFELLEHILLDDSVAMDVLLLAQRVNKTFNATINNSKALQQKLFFASLPVEALRGGEAPKVNPLFTKQSVLRCIPLYFDVATGRLHYTNSEELRRVRLAVDAPSSGLRSSFMTNPNGGPWVSWHFYYKELSAGSTAVGPHDLMVGSWRRMYLCQPAYPVKCTVTVLDEYDDPHSRGNIICRNTCALNDLLDVLAEKALDE